MVFIRNSLQIVKSLSVQRIKANDYLNQFRKYSIFVRYNVTTTKTISKTNINIGNCILSKHACQNYTLIRFNSSGKYLFINHNRFYKETLQRKDNNCYYNCRSFFLQ